MTNSSKPNLKPSEILKTKLEELGVSDDVSVKIFDKKQFIREAQEVRRTFKDEDLQPKRDSLVC